MMNVSDIGKEMEIIRIRIPDSRPTEVRKMCSYAYTLKSELLKGKFLHLLQAWKFSSEDIENLVSVMLRYPRNAINEQQMKWLNEYKDALRVSASTNENDKEEIEQAKEAFRMKYGGRFDNIDSFFNSLPSIRGKGLKAIFDKRFAKDNVTFKDFFKDCCRIVPWRRDERGWNYDAIKKY